MYVPYSRLHETKPRKLSEGGETVPEGSEIVIDPPESSPFRTWGTKVSQSKIWLISINLTFALDFSGFNADHSRPTDV